MIRVILAPQCSSLHVAFGEFVFSWKTHIRYQWCPGAPAGLTRLLWSQGIGVSVPAPWGWERGCGERVTKGGPWSMIDVFVCLGSLWRSSAVRPRGNPCTIRHGPSALTKSIQSSWPSIQRGGIGMYIRVGRYMVGSKLRFRPTPRRTVLCAWISLCFVFGFTLLRGPEA